MNFLFLRTSLLTMRLFLIYCWWVFDEITSFGNCFHLLLSFGSSVKEQPLSLVVNHYVFVSFWHECHRKTRPSSCCAVWNCTNIFGSRNWWNSCNLSEKTFKKRFSESAQFILPSFLNLFDDCCFVTCKRLRTCFTCSVNVWSFSS